MAEFESAYQSKIVPILKAHGLTESSDRGRAAPDSIFSRLFEMKTPSEVEENQKALQGDSTWTAMLRNLGATFGTPQSDGLIRNAFLLYTTPAGPGKTVPAGPGKTVPAGPGTGQWRTYDATDGLTGTRTRSIIQDREGNLWFSSHGGGVSRYDGKTFTAFTTKDGLAGNSVSAILQDREGNFWFGTRGGVSRFDPSATLRTGGKEWTTFTRKDGLGLNSVLSILQDREGNLWFGGGGGVSRYDGKTWTTFTTKDGLAANSVWPIFQDREGNFWFGTSEGVSRYDGKTHSTGSGQAWKTFTTKDGLATNGVWSIFQDRDGALWFGSFTQPGGGVSRYDPSASLRTGGKSWATFSTKDGMGGEFVSSMLQDNEGNLWFGTVDLTRYDGKNWRTFTPSLGMYSLFQDREGYLWAGTEGGVSRYGGKSFTTFTSKDGLAADGVGPLFQDRDRNLWFGTSEGVCRYDGKTFTTFTTKDGLAGNYLGRIFQDREGNLWFGSSHPTGSSGLTRYDGKSFTIFTTRDGLVNNQISEIFQDRKGDLWFGTGYFFTGSGGVSRYNGKTFTTFTTQDGLANNVVSSIFQDREGRLWFGTWGGVSRYDGKTITTFTTRDSLEADNVGSIFQDRKGNLWFGTWGGGVSRYDGTSWTTFTTADGLANNTVSSILQDRDGDLWFGTLAGGVSRYDGKVFQTLSQKDGLAGNSVNSMLQDREGNLWFSAANGVTRYRKPARVPPPIYIDAVVADRRYEKANNLAVPSTVKLTTFEFHAISFKTRPEAMIYRYRLNGYDQDWKTTHERRVEYQNLPRGTYTFEVQAVDRDLVYSEKPATVTLRVRTPFERIGWMSALGVALALVAWQTARVVRRNRRLQEANTALSSANRELFGLNQELGQKTEALEGANLQLDDSNQALSVANRQIQEANRLKSQFLANMSHELRTPMNAIMGFTNLVLRRAGDLLPERQRDNLTKVKLSADHLLNLINDILDLSKIEAGRVDIKPERFEVRKLVESCCQTVSPLVKPGVALNYEVADGTGEAYTDAARLRQIVINLLSNALKFTEQGEVRVHVCRLPFAVSPGGDGLLEVSVSDTGIGIPPEALGLIFEEFRQVDGSSTRQYGGTGLGLSITEKLTELLGGTIGVESEVGKGSTFTVRIPMVYGERRGDPRGRPSESGVQGPESPSAVSRLPSQGGEEGPGGRVIVSIDDDPNVAVLLREELASEGFRVVSALNADEGIALVKKMRPAAVTVDIIMPGKDGWETIAMLKADPKTRDIPVIVISATDNRELGFKLGVSDYLVKPVSRDALLSVLGRLDSGMLKDILVVDDEPLVRAVICEMLEFNGFTPRSASNGQEALAEIGRVRPDAVFLDLMMPVMDGFEVIERLQAHPELRKIPVVVVTAKDLLSTERAFLQQRVAHVVQKGGLELEALVKDLREMLKG